MIQAESKDSVSAINEFLPKCLVGNISNKMPIRWIDGGMTSSYVGHGVGISGLAQDCSDLSVIAMELL